jgi:hypothetical protein
MKMKNDLTKLKLIGKVKSLTEIYFKAVDKFGEIQKGYIMYTYNFFFNDKGNEIEWNKYETEGGSSYITNKWICKCNKKGDRIEEIHYNPDGSLGEKFTFKYDDKGNQIEKSWYNSKCNNGSLYFKFTYKYDNKENQIEENCYYPDGNLFDKWFYKYNDHGNMIEDSYHNPNGSLIYKDIYMYDDYGNMIEENCYNPDLCNKVTYNYDDKGNQIERCDYALENSLYYDKKTYKYDYDNTGNWIKKTYFKNGIPQTITVREIVYY